MPKKVRKLKRKDGPTVHDYAYHYHQFGPALRECKHCNAWTPRGFICFRCHADPSDPVEEDSK